MTREEGKRGLQERREEGITREEGKKALQVRRGRGHYKGGGEGRLQGRSDTGHYKGIPFQALRAPQPFTYTFYYLSLCGGLSSWSPAPAKITSW